MKNIEDTYSSFEKFINKKFYAKGTKHGLVWNCCLRKKRYRTENEAEKGIKRYEEIRPKEQLRVYFCPYCFGFHITKTELREEIK